MVTKMLGWVTSASPPLRRTLWRTWYQVLAGRFAQPEWTFMNYGYADLEPGAQPTPLDEADEPDRYSAQLYAHVVRDGDLRGKTVLEVGSGRGGGSAYLARYLAPRSVLGVDYSANAVALSRKRHAGIPNLTFQQGDAEKLPCEDGAFDAVVNVESSHCYGSMEKFLGEVFRVLKPGGHFLWADMSQPDEIETIRRQFKEAGLELLELRTITPNVLKALDLAGARKQQAIQRHIPKFLQRPFGDFAGVEGTRVYNSLRAGDVQYLSATLKKPAPT